MSGVLELLRPDLRDFAGYASARRATATGTVWLNANESPLPSAADPGLRLNRYPEPQPAALQARLAQVYGVEPSQLLLGRGDVGVARPEQLVAGWHGVGAEGHGGDGLGAADLEYPVDAAQACGHQHGRIGTAVGTRWRAQHDLTAAGQFGWYAEHQCGRRQRRAAGRHVQTDAADAAQQTPAAHTGRRLDLEVLRHAGTVPGQQALACLDHRLPHLVGHFGLRTGEFLLAHARITDLDAVEASRQRAHRAVAVGTHLLEHAGHCRRHLRVDAAARTRKRLATRGRVQLVPSQ